MSVRLRRLPTVLLAAALPLLAACENSATAFTIDNKEHALILVREQTYFWSSEVEQAMIASRLPDCQRRVSIHAGKAPLQEMEVFEAGDHLWALHQGARWYLASTEQCRVQDWADPDSAALGPRVGSFVVVDGAIRFRRDVQPE